MTEQRQWPMSMVLSLTFLVCWSPRYEGCIILKQVWFFFFFASLKWGCYSWHLFYTWNITTYFHWKNNCSHRNVVSSSITLKERKVNVEFLKFQNCSLHFSVVHTVAPKLFVSFKVSFKDIYLRLSFSCLKKVQYLLL